MSYDPDPRYPIAEGEVELGYDPLVADCVRHGAQVVALDGPPAVEWGAVLAGLRAGFSRADVPVAIVDVREYYRPWHEIERLTDDARLAHDPVFARRPAVTLAELLGPLPAPSSPGLTLVAGPGAALVAQQDPALGGDQLVRPGEVRGVGLDPELVAKPLPAPRAGEERRTRPERAAGERPQRRT